MKPFDQYQCGMGIGGWLTNYKRIKFLPEDKRYWITVGDMEHFESYITKWDVQNIKAMGFDHIRLTFDQVVVEEYDKPFVYRETVLQIIDRFLNWCEEADIRVVLNLHHAIGCYCDFAEGTPLLDQEDLRIRFIRLWEMLEERCHGRDTVFEILNEVTTTDSGKWNALADRTIRTLRALNPNRRIILGSAQWNSPDKLDELKLYEDENIAYTFHFYEPHEFTHQKTTLDPYKYAYNREIPYPGTLDRYRDFQEFIGRDPRCYDSYGEMGIGFLRDRLKGAAAFVKAHPDKVLWAGEFGTIRHAKTEYRENWMRDMITVLKENSIPWCVWNYLSTPYDCNRFSLVDDDRREFVSEEMKKICLGKFDML